MYIVYLWLEVFNNIKLCLSISEILSLHLGGKLQLTVGHRIGQKSVCFLTVIISQVLNQFLLLLKMIHPLLIFPIFITWILCSVKNEIKLQDAANHF